MAAMGQGRPWRGASWPSTHQRGARRESTQQRGLTKSAIKQPHEEANVSIGFSRERRRASTREWSPSSSTERKVVHQEVEERVGGTRGCRCRRACIGEARTEDHIRSYRPCACENSYLISKLIIAKFHY
jgi:hypothetical protein